MAIEYRSTHWEPESNNISNVPWIQNFKNSWIVIISYFRELLLYIVVKSSYIHFPWIEKFIKET